MTYKTLIFILIAAIAILSRFIFLNDGMSTMPNFSALGAFVLFGACYFKGTKKYLLPLSVLWISDIILNNVVYNKYFDHFQILSDPWVLGSFALCIFLASKWLKNPNWSRLALSAVGTGIVFYLITNFAVWLNSGLYTKDLVGLVDCYVKAVPFFRNTLLSNLIYGFAFFGIYEMSAHYNKSIVPLMPVPWFIKQA